MKRDTCDICTFVDKDPNGPQLYCHANPPVAQVIPQPTPEGVRMVSIASFAPVQPDQWCGHWKPAILVSSRLS